MLAVNGRVKQPSPMNAIWRGLSGYTCMALFVLCASMGRVSAQSSTDQTSTDTNAQVAALQLQLTNAWHQVETIVNQLVPAYQREQGYDVSVYIGGWFHPGAMTPDFNTIDVRTTRELPYADHTWVSSDITPNMMFHGSDLEFNSMTKLFYTNRSLPKKKLSEAEMEQINALYRTIGHCQTEIAKLEPPPPTDVSDDASADADALVGTNNAASAKAIASIERIPKQTRMLYGSIAIGALIVLVVGLRLIGKKSE